jgi:hypothetical protein
MKEGEKADRQRPTQVGRAIAELGVQTIAAYSPQAAAGRSVASGRGRGGCHRSCGWQESARATGPTRFGATPVRYRPNGWWPKTKDNAVAIGNRLWQIDKTRFRNTLAGTTVTIHEHLDQTVSIRFGPYVVGRFDREGVKLNGATTQKRRGKGGSMEAGENQKQVLTGSHTPLETPQKQRASQFPTAPTTVSAVSKAKIKPNKAAA